MTSGPNDPNVPGTPDPYPGGAPQPGAHAQGGPAPSGPPSSSPQTGGPQHQAPQYQAPQYQSAQNPPPQYGGQQNYPAGANQMGGAGRPGELLPRFGARILDGIIVGIPLAIVWVILAVIGGVTGSVGSWFFGVLASLVAIIAVMGYFSWMEANEGQTLGKRICKLRTEGPNGGNPTMEQAVKRNAFYLFALGGSLISAVLSIGFLWFIGSIISFLAGLAGLAAIIVIAVTISNSPTKQGKHDEFAGGTRVVTTE